MIGRSSLGAFLDLTAYEPEAWERDLAVLEALDLDHLELWLEFEPQPSELTVLEALLGCEVVTLHAGHYPRFELHSAVLDRLAERFARLDRSVEPIVTLENMPERGGASSDALVGLDDFNALSARLPDLSITLDSGHCIQNGENVGRFVETHHTRIRNVHLHDACKGGSGHMALGSGDLSLDQLVGALDRVDYSGFITIETLTHDDLKTSLDVLRAIRTGSYP
jgi:sugar phosphate isomerase/epimerase